MRFDFDSINYNKLRYLDIINFYKLCFINQSENFAPRTFKSFLLQGNYHRAQINYLLEQPDFKIFYKYKPDEINAAMDFFTSLDHDNIINRR